MSASKPLLIVINLSDRDILSGRKQSGHHAREYVTGGDVWAVEEPGTETREKKRGGDLDTSKGCPLQRDISLSSSRPKGLLAPLSPFLSVVLLLLLLPCLCFNWRNTENLFAKGVTTQNLSSPSFLTY